MDISKVILVDENDNPVGEAEKMQAHIEGLLHRAFSVFIFNSGGEMLLQQRAQKKYHSGGLWTNACCSHPVPGETTASAAVRRLQEEMGFVTEVEKIFEFSYKAAFENGLTEHEFDHVFAGQYDGVVNGNPDEIMNVCYRSMNDISQSLQSAPEDYTAWFRLAFPQIENWWNGQYKNKVA